MLCLARLFSIFLSGYARTAMPCDPIVSLVRMSFEIRVRNCDARCEGWSAKVCVISSNFPLRKKSTLPLSNGRRCITIASRSMGPFDIIGDVHGCFEELTDLLAKLGYALTVEGDAFSLVAPEGRRLVFVGDLVDRGPASPRVLKLVEQLVASGQAFCVPGNHDVRLMRVLRGKDTPLTYGLGRKRWSSFSLKRPSRSAKSLTSSIVSSATTFLTMGSWLSHTPG